MKEVTNEEFENAWADKNNIKLMNSVIKKYGTAFTGTPASELKSIKMIALWKCLGKHDYTRQKFTSSLYRFINWECLKTIKENSKYRQNYKQIDNLTNNLSYNDSEEWMLVDVLNEDEYSLYSKYFKENHTLSQIADQEGLSQEWIRQKILKIKSKLIHQD